MSFYNWLMKFSDVDLPIGDFARDAAEDKNFPQNVSNWDNLHDYIFAVNPGAEFESIENAFNYYLAEEHL